VVVDDSKAVHGRLGVAGLARGVCAFAEAMGVPSPLHLEDLLRRFAERGPEAFARPWHGGLASARVPEGDRAPTLRDRLLRRGVEAADLRVLPLDAADLNDLFRRHGNKATVLGVATGDLLRSALDRHPGVDADVVLDRHGGRLHYEAWLADLFPFAPVRRRPAPRGEARYDVALPDRRLFIRVATGADRRFLSVGWASMAAKLVRELFMERLNAWFSARKPDLRPTAGYYGDGRRFLDDVAPVLELERVPEATLVRAR
jgi:hypothetical protein